MKSALQFLKAAGMEGAILIMLAVLAIGSVVVSMTGINTPDGTGTHAGRDVRDNGTNPWQ